MTEPSKTPRTDALIATIKKFVEDHGMTYEDRPIPNGPPSIMDLCRQLETDLANVREEVRQAYEDSRVALQARINELEGQRADWKAACEQANEKAEALKRNVTTAVNDAVIHYAELNLGTGDDESNAYAGGKETAARVIRSEVLLALGKAPQGCHEIGTLNADPLPPEAHVTRWKGIDLDPPATSYAEAERRYMEAAGDGARGLEKPQMGHAVGTGFEHGLPQPSRIPPMPQASDPEPICWLRTLNAEPDWGDDCVGDYDMVMNGYAKDDGYDAIPLYGRLSQGTIWHPASEPPPVARHQVSEWVLATDGKGQIAMRFYRHGFMGDGNSRWGGDERGYLWDVTHWMPCPPKPESAQRTGNEADRG